MAKPKALIISYHFPPDFHVGARRAARIAKYLPRLGWEVWVLTLPVEASGDTSHVPLPEERIVRIAPRRSSAGAVDEAAAMLGDALPQDSRRGMIVRLKGWASRSIGMRMDELLWVGPALEAAKQLVKEHQIDVIFSSCSPFPCHMIANKLKRSLRIPWVADFRDPWANNPWAPGNAAWQRGLRKLLEHRVVRNADYITFVTKPMRDHFMKEAQSFDPARVLVFSHGFDPEDFADVQPLPETDHKKMIISHTGTLGGYRPPAGFFDALAQTLEQGLIPRDQLELRLIGMDDDTGKEGSIGQLLAARKLQDVVKVLGVVPHHVALAHQLSSDLLLYLQTRADGGEIFASAKIYEYLGANRPVLAVAGESAGVTILRNAQVATIVPPDNPAAIAAALRSHFCAWQAGKTIFQPCREVVASFEEPAPIKALAEILNKAIGEADETRNCC